MRRKNLERRQMKEMEEKKGLLKNLESAEDLKLFPLRHHKPVLVRAEEVRISYGEKRLPPVSFTIENGEQVVLRGKNGCGKSSFLKLLLSEQADACSYTGKLEVASGLKISYVSQETQFLQGRLKDFAESRGVDETLFLAILRKLDFSREQFEKNMEDYSGGQKKKVLLAASLCEKAHLYVWDEPLNFIDVYSRMQLEELICRFRPTMLLVEHDKAFVDKVAAKVVDYKKE